MRKLTTGLAVLALLLCMAPLSPATIYFRFHIPLQTLTGEAISGATYFVYAAGTTDTAAIYSDRAGTRNYQGTGETTSTDGMVDFYAEAGCYDVAYTHTDRDLDSSLDTYCEGVADSITINTVTYKGNLPAAASNGGKVFFNAGLDSCWISNGTAWFGI